MDQLIISLVQMDIIYGNKEENLIKAELLAKKAISSVDSSSPHLICFPELFSTGYDLTNIGTHAESIPEGKTTSFLQNLASENSVILVASYIEHDENNYYNTGVVINENGSFKGKYRKIHLFPLHPLDETKLFTSGNIFIPSFNLSCGNMGLLLCFDLRFPEISRRMVIEGNIDFLVYLAEFPNPRYMIWTSLLKARAIENQIYVCGVNRTGQDPNISFFGRSVVYDPLGNPLIEGSDKEEILTVILDPKILNSVRTVLYSLEHRRSAYY
jgi:predicted amidohydrolase